MSDVQEYAMAAPPHIAHNAVILWNSNSDVAMNQQLWQKVEQLFHTALERAPDGKIGVAEWPGPRTPRE